MKFEDCLFQGCTTGSGLIYETKAVVTLSVLNCEFIECRSYAILIITECDSVTFERNVLNLSLEGVDYAVKLAQAGASSILIDNCSFSNNDCVIGQRFVDVSPKHTEVQFVMCTFANTSSTAGGGGIRITAGTLIITECRFTRCKCTNDGGAVHTGETASVQISDCVFEECKSEEGYLEKGGCGGLFIDYQSSGEVRNCIFINNQSPKNGQSLQVNTRQGYHAASQVTVENCTFTSHSCASVVAFVYQSNQGIENYSQEYVLSSCNFIDNTFVTGSELNEFGVLNAQSSIGVHYEDCNFTNTVSEIYDDDNWPAIIVLDRAVRLTNCSFDGCIQRNDFYGGILFSSLTREFTSLNIEHCKFHACEGVILKILSTVACTVSIDDTDFEQHTSFSFSSIISMGQPSSTSRITSLELTECRFTNITSGRTLFDIRSASSIFSHCVFQCSFDAAESGIDFYPSVDEHDILTFDSCTFENNNAKVGHFIYGRMKYDQTVGDGEIRCNNCTFSDMVGITEKHGVAICASYTGALSVTECKFYDISVGDEAATSAIFTSMSSTIAIESSAFERCSGNTGGQQYAGAGAVYFDTGFTSATVIDCRFVNNSCDSNGQSLQFYSISDRSPTISITNCTFADHMSNLPLISAKSVQSEALTQESDFPTSLTISNVTFENNNIGSTEGVVYGRFLSITYDKCTFTENHVFGSESGTCFIGVCRHTSESSCLVSHCTFESCEQTSSSGSVICYSIAETGQQKAITIENCQFISCTCSSGVIHISGTRVLSLTILDNYFKECISTKSSSIMYIYKGSSSELSYVRDLRFERNDCILCQGAATSGSLVSVISQIISFSENVFSSSSISSATWIDFDLYKFGGDTLVIDECSFDNNDYSMTADVLSVQFLLITIPVSYNKCVFQHIERTNQGGAAIYVSSATNAWTIYANDCNFSYLKASGNGGAVYLGVLDDFSVNNCTFEHCESQSFTWEGDGGGALFIEGQAKQGSIVNCRFVGNTCPGNGMSLIIVTQNDLNGGTVDRITISECEFVDHESGKTLIFLPYYLSGDRARTATYPTSFCLSNCHFSNNLIGTEGVLKLDSQVGITYDSCTFTRNEGTDTTNILGCVIHEQSQLCRLTNCVFDNSDSSAEVMSILVLLKSTSSALLSLELSSCEFISMKTSQGVIGTGTASARTLADTPFADTMSVSNCSFTGCTATSNGFLVLSAKQAHITESNFSSTSGSTTSISVQVSEGESTIEDTSFTWNAGSQLVSSPMMTLSCSANAEVNFHNCCFTHTGETPQGAPIYLAIDVSGAVHFSIVCFDTDKSTALSQTGEGTVSYNGTEGGFFENCMCWAISTYTDEPEPPTVSETEPTHESGETEEPVPIPSSGETAPPDPSTSSSSTGTETDDPDAGGGGGTKGNAGLIAGVVIAVLVIIAIVVVIVILFLRRRRQNSDEGVGDNTEFTEETVTAFDKEGHMETATSDWAQTTEDNPLMAAESEDFDSPFANAFEEGGFLGE